MAKTKQAQLTIYLEAAQAEEFDALAATTRIPKAALAREAIGDLLVKWKRVRATSGAPRNVHTATKAKRSK